jgi:signal transduction histidine kinase
VKLTPTPQRAVVLAVCLYVTALVVMGAIEFQPGESPDWLLATVAGFSVALGVLVEWRSPNSPAASGLVLLGAAPTATAAIEAWGESFGGPGSIPGAHIAAYIAPGVWVFNLTGFVVLASNFPSGRLPGRRWSVPRLFLLTGALVVFVVGVLPEQYEAEGGALPGAPPFDLPAAVYVVAMLATAVLLVGVLVAAVRSVVLRYRAGDDVIRSQLRWFVLGAGSVPVLLVAGWIAEISGASIELAYTPFMVAITVLLPVAVTIGVLRHDLFDIDRILSDTIAGILTTVVAAAVFALVVTTAAQTGTARLEVGEASGLAAAAFVTALLLYPVHRFLHRRVGRVIDRDRVVVLGAVRSFVDGVRDGTVEAEQVEDELRRCLDDPTLMVLLEVPGRDGLTRLDGTRYDGAPNAESVVTLDWHDHRVGAVVLGRVSKRRARLARAAAVEARLAIDVSRLRMELRHALDDAHASRLRLVEATAIERRKLERDLHDGAQQQIVAVGMRLRSAQRRLQPGDPTALDLDVAVTSLEATVGELRRLAHGMRPALLDDGLTAALAKLADDIPLPVRLQVDDVAVPELTATTTYYVVAEAVANVLKHAHATGIDVRVCADGGGLRVEVSDDGIGGVRPGQGLAALEDRVAALGGRLLVRSLAGRGTTVEAIL